MPVVWHAAASIMCDCSIEASSASLPFRLSWNALLMSDINLERFEDKPSLRFWASLFSERGSCAPGSFRYL
eukprot:jgi/Chrpa1/20352/Chrysochromulina_OHIO_Genome00024682-RA